EFGLGPVPRGWALVPLAAAVGAALAHGPFSTIRWLVPAFVLLFLISFSYMARAYLRAAQKREDRANALVFLAGWAVMFVLSQTDIAGLLGMGWLFGGVQLTSISFGLFHILQSIALSRKHIGSLARADQLNQQLIERLDLLEARHREIGHLNEEL